ncbi:hypothetical protein CRP01_33670 [Flavilitoribacter nigricans DSM 23189 = NBRC 102662]|uniref:Uncharacterized protein n=1 Tax=Flavilitoribacter nigricans (strain ATCC 23147 / DSM 23189 / NBRC 102662 / NCIMB 1420 / SS-2) TaxID=1122177 RepID=A0A2D0N129_FLAN2|nr:hypothetical protein CRP01_33670 [Flavilitoribacter nigricans DSM 23189 = NBRC 102662]
MTLTWTKMQIIGLKYTFWDRSNRHRAVFILLMNAEIKYPKPPKIQRTTGKSKKNPKFMSYFGL